jgi:hypothetical protein
MTILQNERPERPMDAFVRDLLCSHPADPAHARYLVPLEDPEQEKMAHSMADWSYGACTDYFTEDTTKEQADRVWDQCLIDARRMLCDEDYARIFEPPEGWESIFE